MYGAEESIQAIDAAQRIGLGSCRIRVMRCFIYLQVAPFMKIDKSDQMNKTALMRRPKKHRFHDRHLMFASGREQAAYRRSPGRPVPARSGRSDTSSEGSLMVAGARFSKYIQIEMEPFPLLA